MKFVLINNKAHYFNDKVYYVKEGESETLCGSKIPVGVILLDDPKYHHICSKCRDVFMKCLASAAKGLL